MDTKPFRITIEATKSDTIVSFFEEKIKEYKKGNTPSVCIDISRVSVLASPEIGQIALLIKAVREKNGDVCIFAPRSTIEETLKLVKFHLIAIIIKDREEFETICSGGVIKQETPEKARRKETEEKTNIMTSKEMGKSTAPKSARKETLPFVTIISFVILTITLAFFIVFSLFQYYTIKSLSLTILKVKIVTEAQKDSLTQELTNCKQEYDLYLELENNNPTEK